MRLCLWLQICQLRQHKILTYKIFPKNTVISQLRNLPLDLPMRKIMLHNLLKHHNLIIFNLILFLLLNRNLLIRSPNIPILLLLFLQPHIIPITIIKLYQLNLLLRHQSNPIIHILINLSLSHNILLTSFNFFLYFFILNYLSFKIILNKLKLLSIQIIGLFKILIHNLFYLLIVLGQKLDIGGLEFIVFFCGDCLEFFSVGLTLLGVVVVLFF